MQKIWMSMGKKHETAGFGKLYGVQPSTTHNAGEADQNTKWLSGAAFVHVTTCLSRAVKLGETNPYFFALIDTTVS